jgi:hypothetical protein
MKPIKTSLIIVILAIGIYSSAECQKPDEKVKIKSIIVTQEKHDMLVKKEYKDSETYFDQKGNILEQIDFKQGRVTKHFKYQYDSENNKIKEEEFDPSGRLIEYSEYKYENGLRAEKIIYDSNKKMKSKKIYKYTTF